MPYRGNLPVRLLRVGRIQPREHCDWRQAADYFRRRPKEQQRVEALLESIPRHGILTPLVVGISARYPDDVYIAHGHHRAVALMQLGAADFPFHWYWIKGWGVTMESDPFPYSTLDL